MVAFAWYEETHEGNPPSNSMAHACAQNGSVFTYGYRSGARRSGVPTHATSGSCVRDGFQVHQRVDKVSTTTTDGAWRATLPFV